MTVKAHASSDLTSPDQWAPVDREALESALLPFGRSTMLPAGAYTDQSVLEWERRHLLAGAWVCLGRTNEVLAEGMTQRSVMAGDINVLLTRDSQSREVAAFAKFGSDLDPATQKQLNRGVRLYELLKQGQYAPMEMEDIVVTLYIGVKGFADRIEVSKVLEFSKAWLAFIKSSHQKEVIDAIVAEKYTITPAIEKTMLKLADEFTTSYSA